MLLPIAYYGNPSLRKKGALIPEITPEIRKLVEDMIETMHHNDGMGLAAPQVNQSLAIFITEPVYRDQEGNLNRGPLRVFINPKIMAHSKEVWKHSEACLSIPGLHGEVERPITVVIQAMDLDGKLFEDTLSWWPARVFLHEKDHIDGILYVDRIHGGPRRRLEPGLQEIKRKYRE